MEQKHEMKTIQSSSTIAKLIPLIDELGVFAYDNDEFLGVIAPWVPSSKFNSNQMTVKSLIHQVPKLEENTPFEKAAALLRSTGVTSLPVVKDGKVIDIFTIYEALDSVENIQPTTRSHVTEDEPVAKAIEIIQNERVSHVPVMNEEECVGVVSALSLLRKYYAFNDTEKPRSDHVRGESIDLLTMPIKNFMQTIPQTEHLSDVIKIMREEKVTAVYTPQGIVTARHLLPTNQKQETIPVELKGWSDLQLAEDVQHRVDTVIARASESLVHSAPEDAKLVLHIKAFDTDGERKRYSLNLRLEHPGKPFVIEDTIDWDVVSVLHQAFDSLQTLLQKQ